MRLRSVPTPAPLEAPAYTKVSGQLLEELSVKDVAQAIVFLQPGAPDSGAAATVGPSAAGFEALATEIEKQFVRDNRSWSAAIASTETSSLIGPETSALALGVPTRAGGTRRAARAAPAIPKRRHEAGPMRFPELGVVLGDLHLKGVQALNGNSNVAYVASSLALSLIRPINLTAVNSSSQTTWGIAALDVDRLWPEEFDGRGIRIGHIDTGVDKAHPALRQAVKDFLLTDEAGFPVSGVSAHDTGIHGTHTAGTIAGRPVQGRRIGVAPGAELYCAAVIEGGNVVARVLAGLNWAVQKQVRIISMSLGVRGYHDDFYQLMRALRDRGVLPVVAVGNEGPGTSRSPGNYDVVLSVGACDTSQHVAGFSSSETFTKPVPRQVPDLVGPGVGVISAKVGGGYLSMDGTSMATPHIAGLAACLWSAKPSATADQVQEAIFQSCTPSPDGQVRGGRGLPNAIRALSILTGKQLPVTPTVKAKARPRRKSRKGGPKKASRAKRPVTESRKKTGRRSKR